MSFCLHAHTHTHTQPLSQLINVLRYACPCVNDALHQVAGVTDMCLVQCTHIFLHQSPNSIVDRVSGSTGLFGGHWRDKIRCFLLKELDCFTSIEWRQNASFPSQLFKSDKVGKNEQISFLKVCWSCLPKIVKVHACWNYSLPWLARLQDPVQFHF